MAWYDVTYACGHSGSIQLYGKIKDREWKRANEETKLCPECWKKRQEEERAKKNAEAAEVNKAAGLPQLEGAEKQIAWAETIRKSMIEHIEEYYISQITDEAKAEYPEEYERIMKGFEALKLHTDASWWIDNQINDDRVGLRRLINAEIEALKKAAEEPPAQIIEQTKIEATVYPENAISNLVAEIIYDEHHIEAFFPERNDSFRKVIKELGYKWAPTELLWYLMINKLNGPAIERAAETGNKLLAAGLPVRIYDPEVRRKAIEGDYEPECKRWVMARVKGEYEGWLAIYWKGYDDDLYRAAKKIAGARWSSPSMVVPPENFEEVLDFAAMYGLKISEKATEIIAAARELKEKALVTGVKVRDLQQENPTPGGKPPVLEVPNDVEIDAELRD